MDNYETIKEVNYFEYYLVEKNGSLFALAKEKNINPVLLATLNGLDSTDYIYKNQKILIPKNNYSYYITKDGDTFNLVAKMFSVSSANLLKENSTVYLKEGQLIVHKNK